MSSGSSMSVYALRVEPGMELKSTLMAFVKDKGLKAAFVQTCVGSISPGAKLRMATTGEGKGNEMKIFNEYYEILSLTGTFSTTADDFHLHISLGDKEGHVFGGHVVGDLVVHTTAEVVLAECQDLIFNREMDARTGRMELKVVSNPQSRVRSWGSIVEDT